MTGQTIFLRFYETEHHGDLENYLSDLRSSGATILEHRLDVDAEEALVKIRVENFTQFRDRFRKTDSAEFTDSLDGLEVSHA